VYYGLFLLSKEILMSKLDQLHPKVKALAELLSQKCKEIGITLSIYYTYRSLEEQDRLYAQGRTTPGKIVTYAKGGQSYHNYRVAFDCAPTINGKIDWNNIKLFNKVGEIGESIGLTWGGRFTKVKNGRIIPIPDLPHFQYTQGLNWRDFQKGRNIA
jgi:peptidoglycan L-alanyl-D-glutamate endopeptidase CwlK